MAGYTGAASAAEAAAAMSVAQAAFLASAGARLDYVIDEEGATYADFTSPAAVNTYRANHRRTRLHADKFYYYDQFRHLLFCEKSPYVNDVYGEAWDVNDAWSVPRPGANSYCVRARQRASTLSSLNAVLSFSRCLGYNAAHELGHCVGTTDHRPLDYAIRLDYSPLADGESVTVTRMANPTHELSLQKTPSANDSFQVSLMSGSAVTFGGLADAISQLEGHNYTATVLENCGGLYSFTIPDCLDGCGDVPWTVRHPQAGYYENVVRRHRDVSLMESPANLINAVLTPAFANGGTYSYHEARSMDFAR